MDLKIYFYKKNIKGRDFARKIGISGSAFSAILNGKALPHKKTMQMIIDALEGDLTEKHLREYYLRKKLEELKKEKVKSKEK